VDAAVSTHSWTRDLSSLAAADLSQRLVLSDACGWSGGMFD
jgi:hypothetical protein